MPLGKLRIERRPVRPGEGKNSGATGSGYRYFFDGIDITPSLTRVELVMGVDQVNTARLEFLVDDIDIDVDAIAAIRAVLDDKEREARDQTAREIRSDEPECTCAEDREGGDPEDHALTCPWAADQLRWS